MSNCGCTQQVALMSGLDALKGLLPLNVQPHQAETRVVVRDGTWCMAAPAADDWEESWFLARTPFGILWFGFKGVKVAPGRFQAELKMGLHSGTQRINPSPAPVFWKGHLTLSPDPQDPKRADVKADPDPPAQGQQAYGFDWRCLALCAPTCVTCLHDIKCWTLCAAGCLLSCALKSDLDP